MDTATNNFDFHYKSVLAEIIESIINIQKGKISYTHPALNPVAEAIRSSRQYAEMTYKYFVAAYRVPIDNKVRTEIDSYIKQASLLEKEEAQEKEKRLSLFFTHPESMRRAIKFQKRLEIITREIVEHSQLTGLANLLKLNTPQMITVSIATEQYAAESGKRITITERLFPQITNDLQANKLSVFSRVIEMVKITILPHELEIAKNLLNQDSLHVQDVELTSPTQYNKHEKIKELA